ncbi:hypothetical protein K431DRAFT_321320 [Polychaeton citri CBS 116435]|uniref:VPS37 C-terminal domain-containing protein n=1 Tax=Polychaeton citri CBS 116435 TaxID=1314669 RepID=A0A9P4Q877_9PEZI|nr:hypothetical protein K431DRAFT_321320 [Polychaeton citri CBS 116435]
MATPQHADFHASSFYAATPPAPPPKPPASTSATPSRGPPLPPPPPSSSNEPSELDGGSVYQQHARFPERPYHQTPQIPPIEPGWLPGSVKEQSVSDLEDFVRDQALQAALLSNPATSHPAILASEAAITPLISSNLQLSQSLLSLQDRLTALRESTQQRLLALRALEQQYRTKVNETETALEAFSPKSLYQKLNASAQEQDSLVRGIGESWLDEEGIARSTEVADIIKRVREARRVGFLRQERQARWDEGRVGGWR